VSYTVEGSIIIPIFFFIIVLAVGIAVDLYKETINVYEPKEVEEMWEVPHFYRYQQVEWALEETNNYL